MFASPAASVACPFRQCPVYGRRLTPIRSGRPRQATPDRQ
jgi:hypothetical protein